MRTNNTITLCLLIVATACSSFQEELVNSEGPQGKTEEVFYATLEQSSAAEATKVYADENLQVLWNADDRISIFNRYTYGDEYAFQGATGKTAGTFAMVADEAEFITGNPLEKIYAVYPYSQDNDINNTGELSIRWPSIQTYKPDSFGIGANVMVSVTTNNHLRFRNVGGYLAFKLYGDNVSVTSITLRGNNGEKLSGKASISCATDEDPTLSFDASARGSLRLNCAAPVSIGTTAEDATVFWFVVPPTQFTQGFNITVCTSEGGVFVKSTGSSYDIQRNTLCRMAAVEVIPADIVPFEDANFKAYCVENFDTDNDGEISLQEAMTIDTISVNTNNIYSVREIEYMPNLIFLRCSGSRTNHIVQGQLTNLDVSHNTALTVLSCAANQLTALDISNNTALETLSCNSNQLTTLDVSNNTALTLLSCNRNELTSLEVSQCSALTVLFCGYNQLTNLNVKDNHSLDHLECYGNPMTSLDLSGCSSLTFVDCAPGNAYAPGLLTNLNVDGCTALESLYCYNNQLTNLNLSTNTALTNLTCYNNQLTSLDVSNNSELTYLRCDSNPYLTDIWIRGGQTVQLRYDSSIARINYIGLGDIILFDDANFKAYCVANFDTNKDGEVSLAEALAITKMNVITDNIESLQGVEYFENLTHLSCSGSGTYNSDSGTWNGRLTSLDVSNNTALTYLSCCSNQLSSLDVSNNTALTYLYCDSNQLSSLDVSNNTALYDLNCSGNQLSSLDVSNNTALIYLSCCSNQLSSLDVSNNTALIYLYCDSNQLSSLDVSNNLALKFLGCFDNRLTSLNVCGCSDLRSLYCYNNQLTALNVSFNTALKWLHCYNNQLTSLDVSNNTVLQELRCNDNYLSSLDVSNNTALTLLNCESNSSLTEIWLRIGQTIQITYDSNVSQVYYKE